MCDTNGHCLPSQLTYQGSTTMWHPDIRFPTAGAITQSANHWSTEETMIKYIKRVLFFYVAPVFENLPVSQMNHPALAISDELAAHRSESVLSAPKKANMSYVFVTADCTDELKPLNQQTVNKKYKELLKTGLQNWYSENVIQKL